MNVKNNKRRRESIEKITKVFIELIQTHELSEIIMYHMEFFRGGFNRIVMIWLDHGCDKSPEEIAQIISSEYQGRN